MGIPNVLWVVFLFGLWGGCEGIHRDQVGDVDWQLEAVGRTNAVWFGSSSRSAPILVGSDLGIVASLSKSNGRLSTVLRKRQLKL